MMKKYFDPELEIAEPTGECNKRLLGLSEHIYDETERRICRHKELNL